MFRNLLLQDLPYVLAPRSLQVIGTSRLHTSSRRQRKFWNLFEFSRKDNRKDVPKLSKGRRKDRDSTNSSNNQLNDTSKSMIAITNSNKLTNEYTFRYITRIKPGNRRGTNDDLTSLLDGNLVPTNMKLKLKGYKSLRSEEAKDFAFVPGGKCFELDILPSKKEDGTMGVTYKLTKADESEKVEKQEEPSLPRKGSINGLVSHTYVPFPPEPPKNSLRETTNPEDPAKIVMKENQELQDKINIEKQNDVMTEAKDVERVEPVEAELKDTAQSQNQSELNDPKQESLSLAPEEIKTNSSNQILNELSTSNQQKIQDSVSEVHDDVKIVEPSSSYIFPKRMTPGDRPRESNSKKTKKHDTNVTNARAVKPTTKIPRYSMYESRMDSERRSSSPYSSSFAKARENSTKQRWTGFDRPATGCGPRSSGSHGSQGSTRPYTPTVPTRDASFYNCYARERDPIVRSDIADSRKMVKTRNSVTAASIASANFPEASTAIKGERMLLGSKSTTGFTQISQTVSYGSFNKSNSNQKNSCGKKQRDNCEEEQMIPGKVICTKPRKKECPKPKKSCERKFSCVEEPPPPRKTCKPKKKKPVCKRYCCPELQPEDCPLKKLTCPKKGKKCDKNDEDRHDDVQTHVDPTCQKNTVCFSTTDSHKQQNNDCNVERVDTCGPVPEICTTPHKCNKSRNCNSREKEDECLEPQEEPREICTKPKKKECCNSKRNSGRRSNSCGNRRYHSETRPLRTSKSFITIPMFDVSIVSFRPYQNDSVLRFYSSSCGEDDPCKKPKSICGNDIDDTCSRIEKQNSCNQQKDPCAKKADPCCPKPKPDPCCPKPKPPCCPKPKQSCCPEPDPPCPKKESSCCPKPRPDPCAPKPEPDPCCPDPQPDPCGLKPDTCKKEVKKADCERLRRELKEMEECKNIKGSCEEDDNDSKCKFDSINDQDEHRIGLCPSLEKLHGLPISYWRRRSYDIPLFNLGIKPDNPFINRTLHTLTKIDDHYEDDVKDNAIHKGLALIIGKKPPVKE